MRRAWLAVVAVLAACATAPVSPEEAAALYRQAIEAQRRECLVPRPCADGQWLGLLLRSAEAGHADAQVLLGAQYALGVRVSRDYVEAYKWYERAAAQGDVGAMTSLGQMHYRGEGRDVDYGSARKWYEAAVANGSITTLTVLGVMDFEGHGRPRDPIEAIRKWEQAAAAGEDWARFNLTRIYATGDAGVPADASRAMDALGRSHKEANDAYALASTLRTGFWHKPAGGEPGSMILKEPELAVRWYRVAADAGHAPAQAGLGAAYAQGAGIAQDCSEAVRWYRIAAAKGDGDAMRDLGKMYLDGPPQPCASSKPIDVKRDPSRGVEWLRKGTQAGNIGARFFLAEAYEKGIGVAVDHRRALELYRQSAVEGHAPAALAVARFYRDGIGVPADAALSDEWKDKALDLFLKPEPGK